MFSGKGNQKPSAPCLLQQGQRQSGQLKSGILSWGAAHTGCLQEQVLAVATGPVLGPATPPLLCLGTAGVARSPVSPSCCLQCPTW